MASDLLLEFETTPKVLRFIKASSIEADIVNVRDNIEEARQFLNSTCQQLITGWVLRQEVAAEDEAAAEGVADDAAAVGRKLLGLLQRAGAGSTELDRAQMLARLLACAADGVLRPCSLPKVSNSKKASSGPKHEDAGSESDGGPLVDPEVAHELVELLASHGVTAEQQRGDIAAAIELLKEREAVQRSDPKLGDVHLLRVRARRQDLGEAGYHYMLLPKCQPEPKQLVEGEVPMCMAWVPAVTKGKGKAKTVVKQGHMCKNRLTENSCRVEVAEYPGYFFLCNQYHHSIFDGFERRRKTARQLVYNKVEHDSMHN